MHNCFLYWNEKPGKLLCSLNTDTHTWGLSAQIPTDTFLRAAPTPSSREGLWGRHGSRLPLKTRPEWF